MFTLQLVCPFGADAHIKAILGTICMHDRQALSCQQGNQPITAMLKHSLLSHAFSPTFHTIFKVFSENLMIPKGVKKTQHSSESLSSGIAVAKLEK